MFEPHQSETSMKVLASTAAAALLLGSVAIAQGQAARPLTSLPQDGTPVTNYYKQNVYDPSDTKIGEVMDLVVEKDGKVAAAIVSVGGFLGAGEKDVAVPFNSLKLTQKNQKWYLVMNTDKDSLKNAPGFRHDKNQDRWVPDTK
jgi:sporulation protein YlmC with PRC-barrel domain